MLHKSALLVPCLHIRLRKPANNRHSGSTATIIRLPYTSTLKPYKGDFLYRTTDFAIWTTVEVGIGIAAGCIATLRPLLKSTLGSTGGQNSSGKWWSRKNKSSHFSGMQLPERLRTGGGAHGGTKTTITGGRVSEESDKKTFLDTGVSPEAWKNGINKSVSTTVVAERSESRIARNQSMSKGRGFSNDSNDSLGDVENGRPAIIHERF
jgi:hypothetical protein